MKRHSIVQVVTAIDREIHDVSMFIGRIGEVLGPATDNENNPFFDALIVGFCDGEEELFWPEEVKRV